MLIVVSAACSSPTKPSTPEPTISCPTPPVVQALDANPVTVTYPSPVVSGGAAPVTTTCLPPTGSAFPVGSTNVTCTVRDSEQRSASCSFAVTVTRVPRLSVTRFVAFGDSITSGVTSTCPGTISPEPLSAFLADMRALAATTFETSVSYPSKLRAAFSLRYPGQPISVVNEGVPGEQTTTALGRLPSVLDIDRPEVLLLQHGANDIFGHNTENMVVVRDNVRRMIQVARGRQVAVLVGTLLPQRQGACRGSSWDLVPQVNDLLRFVVATEGAVLVDLFAAFGGQPGTLIGPDGLHPNEAGYQKMADTFFDTIRQRFE